MNRIPTALARSFAPSFAPSFALSFALSLAVFLGACASSAPDRASTAATPSSTSAKPPTVGATTPAATSAAAQPATTAAAAATPATPAVKMPAAAARKVVLAMTGSRQAVEAKDWAAFKTEWRETFAEHAKDAGIAFAFQDGEARPLGEDGTLLSVHVEDYRMVGIGARIFFGIMTGNAYIDASVRFLNLRDGAEFGSQKHNTSSSAWAGVFAKMTPQQVDAIASDIFKDVKAAR